MKIKPIGKRILIKQVKVETKTKTGIYLPDTASKEEPITGEVIAVGNSEVEKDIKVNDKIIYAKYSGTEIKDGEDKLILLELKDVLAIVEEM